MGRLKRKPRRKVIDPNEFINWATVSVYFTGNINTLRAGRDSGKYGIFTKRLLRIIHAWMVVTKPFAYKKAMEDDRFKAKKRAKANISTEQKEISTKV